MIVVYTAVAGGFDTVKPLKERVPGVRYVAFTDLAFESDFWEVKVMTEYNHYDPRRRTRYYKMHPSTLFPEATITVWLDASTDLAVPLKQVLDHAEQFDLTGRTHPARNCLFEEGIACVNLGYDPITIANQLERYEIDGFPKNFGLIECRLLVRKNNPSVNKFNELWFEEYEAGSERDQVSMMYCAWKTGLTTTTTPLDWVTHRPHNRQ